MNETNYRYLAFISYSRKNMAVAKKLQTYLENFRLPSTIHKQYPLLPKRLKPIFRDMTDINTGNLKTILKENLRDSKYLIVVCSKESGKSFYVNQEVEYFCSLGREDRIIPIIISGTPDDSEESCYPPALSRHIVGANVKEGGVKRAFVRVAATMLDIGYDMLWQRERRRQRKRWIVLTSLTMFFLLGAGIGTYYYMNYYLPEVRFSSVKHIGETVRFGSYEQDNNLENGAEPIKWEVLEQYDDGTYLLTSRECLEASLYHENRTDITWEDCTLRAWLNQEFYENAFSAKEQEKIVLSDVINKNSLRSQGVSEYVTKDYVYLLSINEAKKYFGEETTNVDGEIGTQDLICEATAYAVANGLMCPNTDEMEVAESETGFRIPSQAVPWWLRSTGGKTYLVANVEWYGAITAYGGRYPDDTAGVRPVIRTHLSSKDFEPVKKEEFQADLMQVQETGDNDAVESVLSETSVPQQYDMVTLGHYEQDGIKSNGTDEIMWRVLKDNGDGTLLILSEYGLDISAFAKQGNSWEHSLVRDWLNHTFYESAFEKDEKERIVPGPTDDPVWLLNLEEVQEFLPDDESRVCYTTMYAKTKNAHTAYDSDACYWLLRSPVDGSRVACVNSEGSVISYDGNLMMTYNFVKDEVVRPAMIIKSE